jgi:hypothetical protein
MDSEIKIATTTDGESALQAAADGDEEGARVAVSDSSLSDFHETESEDGRARSTSYENPQSERKAPLERLAAAESEVELPPEEESEPKAQRTPEQSEIDIEAVRKAATEDAIRDARARMAQQQAPSIESQYSAVLEQAGANFASRMEEIKAKDPSLVQLAQKLDSVIFPPEVREAMVYAGADVAAYLIRNPAEARRVAALPPLAGVAHVGALATQLTRSRPAVSVHAPILRPVQGNTAPVNYKSPENMTYSEYCAWREKNKSVRK